MRTARGGRGRETFVELNFRGIWLAGPAGSCHSPRRRFLRLAFSSQSTNHIRMILPGFPALVND